MKSQEGGECESHFNESKEDSSLCTAVEFRNWYQTETNHFLDGEMTTAQLNYSQRSHHLGRRNEWI